MYLKIISAFILLATVSTGLQADVYKCKLSSGRTSYQQSICPSDAVQHIVHIFGNSSRTSGGYSESANPWVLKLAAKERARDKANLARAERQQESRERIKYAALTKKRDEKHCKEYKALYKKRKKQGGVKVINVATGKISLDKSKMSKDLIRSTKDTRDMYCG